MEYQDLFYIEDNEDNQYFYEYALPDVFTTDAVKIFHGCEGNEFFSGGGEKSNP